MTWRILVVGVDHAIDGRGRLRHAEASARQLAEWMTARLDGRCEVRCLIAPTCQEARDAMAWLAQVQHRLLVWTGHAERLAADVHLVTGDTGATSNVGRMLSFDNLEQILATASDETTTAVVLDTCYAGALQSPRLLDDGATGATYLISSALPAALAVERGLEHGLAARLLQALDQCANDAWRRSQREIVLADLWQRLAAAPDAPPTVEIRQRGRDAQPLPLAARQPDGRGRRLGSLEQALGFAVQAFRDYLDREVVRGVELIYFLSYDPWDGCLVYDGLVQGSIEQTLLDAIRGAFLDRDRQRSKFREKRGSSALGPAGQCYERALAELAARKANKKKTPEVFIGSPMFMGNLNIPQYASSEFRAFDRLLGLTCCLYLPIVLHAELDPDQPLGGVIMAASRTRWSLEPRVPDGKALLARAAHDPEPARADARISEVIGEELRQQRARSVDGHHRMDDFVRCIAAVYRQRRLGHGRIRQQVHPVAAKSVVRLLRNPASNLDADRQRAIAEISDRLERDDGELLDWIADLHEHGIDRYLPAHADGGSLTLAARRSLLCDYLAIDLWRELELRQRRAADPEQAKLQRWLTGEPLSFLRDAARGATTVDAWVHRLALINDTTPERERNYREPGDIRAFQRDAINDLLDAMRDGDGKIVDVLIGFLGQHAPVRKYARGIAAIHAVLDADAQHQLLEDLAHAVHVYLLGLWLMFTPDVTQNHRIADDAALHIAAFFRSDAGETRADLLYLRTRLDRVDHPDTGLLRRGVPASANAPADMIDELGLAWGFVAAMHDLGLPLQRFEEWGRKFFERYFDHSAGRWPGPSGFAEIFLHPRFPVYKNALVSLYRDRHVRDWLDAVFCRQLTGGIQHGFAGALLVANELEPDGHYPTELGLPSLWSRIPERLQAIYGTSEAEPTAHLERELVFPAYLAHAVALGHGEPAGSPAGIVDAKLASASASRPRRRYFEDIATYFRVAFDEFPLTWLLAVCNALAVPTSQLEESATSVRRPGGEPLLRFVPATNHATAAIGASPFFVRSVKPTGERTLTLTLAPWRVFEDSTWGDGRARKIPRARIDALLAEWKRTIDAVGHAGDDEPTRWTVYSDAAYDALYAHLPPPVDSPDIVTGGLHHEVVRTQRTWGQTNEDYSVEIETTARYWAPADELIDRGMTRRRKHLHLRRGAFEIVYLLYTLHKLDEVYVNAEWRLVVELFEAEPGFAFTIGGPEMTTPAMDSWDTTYQHAGPRLWPHETSLPPFACDWLKTMGPTSVLDLGCGDGKNLKWLVEQGRHHVIGVDGSQAALAQCRQHMAGRDPRSFELLSMDVQALDRKSPLLRELPAAICIDVLGHQPDPERTLVELYHVLRKGAVAVVSVFHLDDDARQVGAPAMQHLGAHDYYYYPQGDAARRQFFRFYRDGEPEALLARAGFVVKRCGLHRWREPAHPGYRDHAHTHTSWFLLVEKPA